jgi:hypothetical protein
MGFFPHVIVNEQGDVVRKYDNWEAAQTALKNGPSGYAVYTLHLHETYPYIGPKDGPVDPYTVETTAGYARHMAKRFAQAAAFFEGMAGTCTDETPVGGYIGGLPVATIQAEVGMSEGECRFKRTPRQ